MTALALLIATALVVAGALASAGTTVAPARGVAAVTSGAVLLLIADGESLTAQARTQSLATAGVPLAAALLAFVVLGGRPATAIALAGAALAGPVRQLLDDPFHDPGCFQPCEPNPLALTPHPALANAAHIIGGAVMLTALLLPARRLDARPLLVAAAAVATLTSARVVDGSLPTSLTFAAAAATAVLAADLSRTITLGARLSRGVTALASTDDPDQVLTEALDGHAVSFGYPDTEGHLVDRDGRPLHPPPQGWTVVEIAGPDGPVAQLRTDVKNIAPRLLTQVLRGPARLALENNRLAAEAAVRSRDIRASAARLVELAENGRRRLEHDLHDGAQRHVLTLGMAIQAEGQLSEDVRRDAERSVRVALDQLRDVAHGIRPPQLDTGGLARGLAVLADRSTVPLVVAPIPADLDGPTSEASYRLVEDVLRTASGPVTVTIRSTPGGTWMLTVAADNGGGLAARASDHFRARGGSVRSQRVGQGWQHVGNLPPTLP